MALIPKVNPEVLPDSSGVPGSPRWGVDASCHVGSRESHQLLQIASQVACVLPTSRPHTGHPAQAAAGPSGDVLGTVRVSGTGILWE